MVVDFETFIRKRFWFSQMLEKRFHKLLLLFDPKNVQNYLQPVIVQGTRGTGKTELLKAIAQYYSPQSLYVTFNDQLNIDECIKLIQPFVENESIERKVICFDQMDYLPQSYQFVLNLAKEVNSSVSVPILIIGATRNSVFARLQSYYWQFPMNDYFLEDKIQIMEYIVKKISLEIGCEIELTLEANVELSMYHRMSIGLKDLEDSLWRLIWYKKSKEESSKGLVRITKSDVQQVFYWKNQEMYMVNDQYRIGIANVLTMKEYINFQLKVEAMVCDRRNFDLSILGELDQEALSSSKVAIAAAINYLKGQNVQLLENETLLVNFYGKDIFKKGSSAGLAVFVAVVSVILKRPVLQNIGFTGQVTLSGDVIRVGHIENKIIQGFNRGITEFYLSIQNELDFLMVPKAILQQIQIHLVKDVHEVFKKLFVS
ncbi:MAG: AAA family ATPase [Halanaerobiales bacterium]|nr:AAA family ATPase [Halanaerobiales bacterium]